MILKKLLKLKEIGILSLVLVGILVFLKDAEPTIIAGYIIAIIGVFSIIITNYSTTQREIDSRHYKYKLESYQIIIDLLFDLHQQAKGMKVIENIESEEKLIEFKKNLLLQGNIKLIQKWSEFEMRIESMKPFEMILFFDEIYQLIREDLGHEDDGIKKGDLASLVLSKKAKKELLQHMKNKK